MKSTEQIAVVNERIYGVKLRHRRAGSNSIISFYDNYPGPGHQNIKSRWTIVRQRLPDILALSETYKPTTVRGQLVLLVALMNKQANTLIEETNLLKKHKFHDTISHIVPSNVIIDISGRSQMICLKRIPSQQMIHVDVNGLSFSIPTRQFILAVSRGDAHETAARYCPPAVRDMLIDLSKTKVIEDRQQYRRAKLKLRVGRMLFFSIFGFIIIMMLALMLCAADTIFKLDSFNKTLINAPVQRKVLNKIDHIFSMDSS